MSKRGTGAVVGVGMVLIGVAMYVVFGYFIEVDTPIIGLRQLGVVLAVIGLIELAFVARDRSR